MTAGAGAVIDDIADHRFVLLHDDDEAELVYRRVGRRLVLVHTGVPAALAGQGVGGRLLGAAIEQARHDDLTLVPSCPFAARWLRAHPEAVAGLNIDWPEEDSTEDLDHG